jgi:RNA polymerase sigma factor (sigma-70 family)
VILTALRRGQTDGRFGLRDGRVQQQPDPMPDSISEDDAALINRCRMGDAQAWAALVHRYQRLVYAIARRIGADEHAAADIFQTVFARLLEHLPGLTQPERLQAWIVTTTKREALRTRHVAQRTVSLTRGDDDDGDEVAVEDSVPDPAPLTEAALDHLQQLDLLRDGLERLDKRCRDLLTLLFSDADARAAYDEVARRLAVPVGSIGPTRSRCLAKLRRLVESPTRNV